MRNSAAIVAAGLSVGAIAGALAAWGGPTDTSGAAAPIPAVSPAVPEPPPKVYAPDPQTPALAPGVKLKPFRLGTPPFDVQVPAPVGWKHQQTAYNESKWYPPDYVKPTYVLRIEQVSGYDKSVSEMIDDAVESRAAGKEDFTLLSRTDDAISISYAEDDHLRVGFLMWLPTPRGDEAGIEISLTGRAQDRDGMDELIGRIAQGVRQ